MGSSKKAVKMAQEEIAAFVPLKYDAINVT